MLYRTHHDGMTSRFPCLQCLAVVLVTLSISESRFSTKTTSFIKVIKKIREIRSIYSAAPDRQTSLIRVDTVWLQKL